MNERTDEQKISREPIKVVLGGKTYKIEPKAIRHSLAWKTKYKPTLKMFFDLTNSQSINAENAQVLIQDFLLNHYEDWIDAVFDWEPLLPKDEILDNPKGSEQELMKAFQAVLQLAYPQH